MRLIFKERLRFWVGNNYLVHLLVGELWFRIALLSFLFLLLFIGLSLPRIWTASPSGFLPVVKVSGLDLAQAWSLKRTALKATSEGRLDEAHYAWRAAMANNQADPEVFRGALRTFLKDERRSERGRDAVRHSAWLLRLTGTNLVDLELASEIFLSQGHLDFLISLLEPRKDQLTPSLESCYLKSLFNRGKINAFNLRWNQVSQKLPLDPELPLYDSAYLIGWGSPSTRGAAQERLDAALQDPARRILACRLQLAVYAHLLEVEHYRKALRKLEEWQADTLLYHTGYWRLLFLSGRRSEAIQLAEAHSHPPQSALETMKLAGFYADVGLRDQALQALKRFAPDFGDEPNLWVFHADQLVEARQWEELRRLAWQMRGHAAVRNRLAVYSYFLEGRAELGLHRQFLADTAFQKLAEWELNDPGLGFSIASQLLKIGYPTIAREMLRKVEKDLSNESDYWMLLFNVADELRDVELMLSASRRAFELRPQEPTVMNNYAASLLISRRNSEEVIGLTLSLLAQNPRSLIAIVNHSAALMLNQRHREAETLLRKVDTTKLTKPQATHYYLDLFELYFNLEQYERAWAIGQLIEPLHLYPPQRQWLDQTRKQLAALSKDG